jgi:hypothetical protein
VSTCWSSIWRWTWLHQNKTSYADAVWASSAAIDLKQRASPEALLEAARGSRFLVGFVEAMRGTVLAANRTDRSGAVLTIRLPIPAAVDALGTAA